MAEKVRRLRIADKVHCLQADEREASPLHPANQENVARRRFIHASRARQQEYRFKQRLLGSLQNRTTKDILLT